MNTGTMDNTEISRRYEIGSALYSTRTADGREAMEKETGERVLLWTLRHPITEEGAARFLARLSEIGNTAIPTPVFRAFGVDSQGAAYLVTDYTEGERLALKKAGSTLQQRLFIEAVRAVTELHDRGVSLGDICEDSFLVNAQGHLLLIALLGSFELEAKKTALLPAPQTLHYLAPEQRSGAPTDFRSDVYALGILGYRIFTGRYPLGNNAAAAQGEDVLLTAPAPSVVGENTPNWADDILGKCIEFAPETRFGDAGELFEAIGSAIQSGQPPGGGGRWSKRTLMVRPGNQAQIKVDRPESKEPREARVQKAPPPPPSPEEAPMSEEALRGKLFLVLAAGLLLGVLGAGVIFVMKGGERTASSAQVSEEEAAPAELQPFVNDLLSSSTSSDQKQLAFERIVQSENPLSYAVLISVVRRTRDAGIREQGIEQIVRRVKDFGLPRTADIFSRWSESAKSGGVSVTASPSFVPLLKAADITLPLDARRATLHKSFGEDKVTTLQVAAALAIDDGEEENFTPQRRLCRHSRGEVLRRPAAVRFSSPLQGHGMRTEN